MKMIVLALAMAATLALAGDAFAQSGGARDNSTGQSPPVLRGPDSRGVERDVKPDNSPSGAVNPQETPATGDTAASEARIRSMLEKQGYGNVQNIKREGDAYTATATKGGEDVNIRIDPQLGQIQEHGG